MANVLFTKYKEHALQGDLNLLTNDIKCVLVDHGVYAPDPLTDEYLADIILGARVAISGNFSGKAITNGIFDADNIVFAALAGATFESVVIYQDTGVEGTSILIAYLDTITGLPFTPSGVDVTLSWSDGPNKIFVL